MMNSGVSIVNVIQTGAGFTIFGQLISWMNIQKKLHIQHLSI